MRRRSTSRSKPTVPEHFRALVTASFDPALLLAADGRVLQANEPARALLDLPPKEGWPIDTVLADLPAIRDLGRRSWQGRLRLAGDSFCEARLTPLYRGRSVTAYFLCLRWPPVDGNEGMACLALERLPLGCALLDREGRAVCLNEALAALAGGEREAMTGRELAESLGLGPDVRELDRRALAANRAMRTDHVKQLEGGEQRVLRFTRIPVTAPSGAPMLLVTVEDITADLDSPDGLAGDARLVRSILDYMPGFLSLKDVHTRRFVFATGIDRVLSGGSRADLIGRSAQELYSPEQAAAIDATEEELVHNPDRVIEAQFANEVGGRKRWFYSRKLIVPDAEGDPRYILTFNMDITDQVEAKEKIFETNAFLDAVIDHLPALVWVRDFETGRIERVSRRTGEFLDLPSEELVGRTLAEIHAGLAEAVATADATLRRDAGSVVEQRISVELARGARTLQMYQVAIPDPEGCAKHIVTIQLDVTDQVRAEQQLADSRAFLRQIIGHLPLVLSVKEATTRRYILANRNPTRGVVDPGMSVLGKRAEDIHPPDIAALVDELDERIIADPAQVIEREIHFSDPEGDVWYRLRKVGIANPDGSCRYIVTISEDVTERRRMLEELERSEASLKRSQQIARIGSWYFRLADRQLEWSEQMYALWGVDPQHFLPSERSVMALVHPEDRGKLIKAQAAAVAGGRRYNVVVRTRRASDDALRHMSVDGEVELDPEGNAVALFGTCQDITERVEAEQRIRRLAQHDSLTGLPNRLLFDDRLRQAALQARRKGSFFAVHCLDLNDFKGVNDSLGHAVGDRLLKQVAERLREAVRGVDTVARLGGDEFAVIQTELEGPQMAANLADRVIEALGRPYQIGNHELFTSASIGIAVGDGENEDATEILRYADLALYAAKAEGRGRFRFFSPEMNAALRRRRLTETRLRQALEENRLTIMYQPQVELATGHMIGVEALLRWWDEELGEVPPDQFITVAEECGLILELGRWILEHACRQAQRWLRQGFALDRVAINLSPAQFAFQDLVEEVAEILEETGLPPGRLEVEITESTLMRDQRGAVGTLRALHELGVGVALDDFGTGYSSLSYLKRFPLDKVKIDRSFVQDLPHDQDSAAITRTIISLGKTLRLKVLAEGVETAEQCAFLLREGCDEAQGYLFSRAVTAEELEELLRDGVDRPLAIPAE